MTVIGEDGEQNIKLCTYLFDKYEHATVIGKKAASLGASDVRVVRLEEKTSLTCMVNWASEMLLIQFAPKEFGNFRQGDTYSEGERTLIREMFSFWYDPVEIEAATRRTRLALREALVAENLLPRMIPVHFNYEDVSIFYEDDYDEVMNLDYTLGQFEKLKVISQETRRYLTDRLASQPTALDAICLMDSAISNDIRSLYNALGFVGCHNEAAAIASQLGDYVAAAKFGRAGYASPENFYLLLKNAEGLPREFLYQREIARAYFGWNIVNGYPKAFSRWVNAAILRRKDCYANELIGIPYPLDIHRFVCPNPILDALVATRNLNKLKKLTLEGNNLAAALLADEYRIGTKMHPYKASDGFINESEISWPSEVEIMEILTANFPYDRAYAGKMAHLGFTYAGCSIDKSYLCTWHVGVGVD